MACPGGCIMGGGQPADTYRSLIRRQARCEGLFKTDGGTEIRASQENEAMNRFWAEHLAGKEHIFLHRNLAYAATCAATCAEPTVVGKP